MQLSHYFQIKDPFRASLVVIFVSCILFMLLKRVRKILKLPKGPYGVPVYGFLPFLKSNQHLQFLELAKKYGPVFSMKLGNHDFVILNDWPSIQEAAGMDQLLGRPLEGFLEGLVPGKGFVEMSGQKWRQQRRLALHLLRNVGFGRDRLDEAICTEARLFTDLLQKLQSKPVKLDKILAPSASNIISNIVYGTRFDFDDPEKKMLDQKFREASDYFKFIGFFSTFPIIVRFLRFFNLFSYGKMVDIWLWMDGFQDRQIVKHMEKAPDYDEDYIGLYLSKMDEEKKKPAEKMMDKVTLQRNLFSFFAAGSDTIFTSLIWSLIFLVKDQKLQERVRSEIKGAIGSREVEYKDRNALPLTQACIYEAMRLRTIVPVNLIRRATEDIHIGKHFIPKDTYVVFNFWAVDHDHQLWKDPHEFCPERFMSEDGSKVVVPPHYTPWSLGKRNCIGEGMAKKTLIQYVVTIIQTFRIKTLPNEEVDTDGYLGTLLYPKKIPNMIFEPVA